VLTLEELVHPRLLLSKFLKGKVRIVTLNAYLQPKGYF